MKGFTYLKECSGVRPLNLKKCSFLQSQIQNCSYFHLYDLSTRMYNAYTSIIWEQITFNTILFNDPRNVPVFNSKV